MTNSIRLILVCLITLTQFSCKNDDDTTTVHPIIGEWLRNDYTTNPTFEFKLHFLEDNVNGMRTVLTSDNNGTTSSASGFEWNIDNNLLTISMDDDDDDIVTSFQFTTNGNLLLPDYSDLEFIRQ
ncbi:hypothetical protein [Olleya sp. R77988]|uniref:hypothetical protein n=1 Tax=Olleya sp. R77988 TaxID=3093875 RepID=UPI0037C6905F